MSYPTFNLEELALKATMCPRCEARPGEKCQTVGGTRAKYMHEPRYEPLYRAWNDGFEVAGGTHE